MYADYGVHLVSKNCMKEIIDLLAIKWVIYLVYVVRIGNELAQIVRTGTLSCHDIVYPPDQVKILAH